MIRRQKKKQHGFWPMVASVIVGAAVAWAVPHGAGAAASAEARNAETRHAEPLVIGMTTALSGPVRELGRSMRFGVEALFAEVNRNGGIHGRPLALIALDDAYDPPTAAANMLTLIRERKVLAVIGNVGTPTAHETVPIALRERVLLFGAMSGASILRPVPPARYLINFRASYGEETAAMVRGLLARGIRPEDIAFFTQNDSYGDDGYNGAVKALGDLGGKNTRALAHGRYARGTLAVEGALITLLEAPRPPKAVIMVGAYAPNAKFIRLARQIFPGALLLNVSFVGSAALKNALGPLSDGVIFTEVVPALDQPLPAVQAFHAAFKTTAPDQAPTLIALEGYLAARVLVAGLAAAGANPNRETIIDGLLSLGTFDIGIGQPLHLSRDDHQASRTVWPTIIRNGKIEVYDWENSNGERSAAIHEARKP